MKTQLTLIRTIEEKLGHPLSPRLSHAFMTVPRSVFVPSGFKQTQPGVWEAFDTAHDIYEDKHIITKVSADKRPSSSSSQPSLMAAMLEALDLKDGLSVLEIGTGTGYNTALLAEIVGPNGSVASIDIDAELVQRASHRMKETYPWVTFTVANGLEDTASERVYDRILVTGGYAHIPSHWINQLKKGGILVGNLLGSLATPLYKLTKRDGYVQGTLLSTPAFFMSLYHPNEIHHEHKPLSLRSFDMKLVTEQAETTINFPDLLQQNGSLKQYVELLLPGITIRHRLVSGSPHHPQFETCVLYEDTLLTFRPRSETVWMVETKGAFPLWLNLSITHQRWKEKGEPSLDQYHVCVDASGTLSIHLSPNAETE